MTYLVLDVLFTARAVDHPVDLGAGIAVHAKNRDSVASSHTQLRRGLNRSVDALYFPGTLY